MFFWHVHDDKSDPLDKKTLRYVVSWQWEKSQAPIFGCFTYIQYNLHEHAYFGVKVV